VGSLISLIETGFTSLVLVGLANELTKAVVVGR